MAYRGSKKLSVEGQALLEWFKAIAQPSLVLDVGDLVSGQLIWSVLQQIRPEEFSGPLPDQSNGSRNDWLSNWQNLKHIYRYLTKYITTEVARLPPTLDGLDLQALAKSEDNEAATKLLKMVLFAAVNADDNAPYISPMYGLDKEQQKLVQQTILEMQDVAEADERNDDAKADSMGDKDLYFEGQLARLSRENETLARAKNDLLVSLREQTERNLRLTQNNSSLQDKLSSLQGKLDETSGSSLGGSVLKDIETKLKEQDDHIAFQETQLTDLQQQNDNLQRDITRLREMEAQFQPLQDSVDELRSERDVLLRKANAMDKYKAKLQTLADLEKENESLRSAMDELREVNRDGNQAKESAKAFQRQIDEMSRMIPAIEQELFESRMMKQQLDANAQDLRKQLESANSRYEQDQNTIRDLQEQIQAGSPRPGGSDSLDNELDDKSKARSEMQKEHVDYRKMYETSREASDEHKIRNQALESMLAAAKLRIKKLEHQVEAGYGAKDNTARFIGSQKDQSEEDIELQRERNLIGQDGTDSVAFIDKDELERMRGYEASALEADELKAHITDLETQVAHFKELIRRMDPGSGPENTINAQKKQLTQKETEINNLKKQLESSKPALLKASEQLQLKQQIENLKRENKLVASAFYDLSSRLQLNNVSLQRRSEAPRSFLNKQRLLVSQATAVRTPR